MAVTSTSITVGTTGATALVAPATITYSGSYSVSRSGRWRTAAIGSTGAFYLGANATGTTVTMALFPANTVVTMPLAPDEGLYGLGVAASVVGVLVTGA
jgi:hypothetical protein